MRVKRVETENLRLLRQVTIGWEESDRLIDGRTGSTVEQEAMCPY